MRFSNKVCLHLKLMSTLIISGVIIVFAKIFGGIEGHKKPYMRWYRRKKRVGERNPENCVGGYAPNFEIVFVSICICGEIITVFLGFSFIHSDL